MEFQERAVEGIAIKTPSQATKSLANRAHQVGFPNRVLAIVVEACIVLLPTGDVMPFMVWAATVRKTPSV